MSTYTKIRVTKTIQMLSCMGVKHIRSDGDIDRQESAPLVGIFGVTIGMDFVSSIALETQMLY